MANLGTVYVTVDIDRARTRENARSAGRDAGDEFGRAFKPSFSNIKDIIATQLAVKALTQGLPDLSLGLSAAANKFTILAGAGTAAIGALAPVSGLLAGVGVAAGVAGAGIGAFAILAKPQLSAVQTALKNTATAQTAYQKAVDTGNVKAQTAALQAQKNALGDLTPAQRIAAQATLDFKDALTRQSNAFATPALKTYTSGLHTLTSLLPLLTPLATAASTALTKVFDQARAGATSTGTFAFVGTLSKQVGPAIDGLATAAKNFGGTLANVFRAAVPLMSPALGVVKTLTGLLSTASGGAGLKSFFTQASSAIVPLQTALHAVGSTLTSLLGAAAPLARPLLDLIAALGGALTKLFHSANFGTFVSNIGSILDELSPLLATLGEVLGKVGAAISGQLLALMPQLIPGLQQFAHVFGDVLVGLSPLLPELIKLAATLVGFLPVLYPVIVAIRDALRPVVDAVVKSFKLLEPSLGLIIKAVISMLPPISMLLVALVPLIPVIVQALVPGFNLLATLLIKLTPVLIPVINLFAKLAPYLLPLAPLIIAFTNPLADAILIIFAVAAAWPLITKAAQAVFNWVKNNWPLLIGIITGPIGLAVYFISQHFDTFKRLAAEAIKAVVGFFLRMAGDILGLADKAFGWVPGLGGKLHKANEAFSKFKDGVLADLTSLEGDHVVHVNVRTAVGDAAAAVSLPNKARQYAYGGLVHGPGGPRDDLIPSYLSNGEFVMNAAATSRHLPLLHAMNAKGYADGGLVVQTNAATAANGLGDQLRTIIDGALSRLVSSFSFGSGGAGVQQWAPLVAQVLSKFGLNTPDFVARWLRQISSESGGNASIVQGVHDVNSGGNEAVGLVQVTPGTFAGYAGPFVGLGRTNPLANLYAGMAWDLHKSQPPFADIGFGHGYDQGGPWPSGTLGWNTSGRTEHVLTGNQMDKMIGLLEQLVGVSAGQGRQYAAELNNRAKISRLDNRTRTR